MADPAEAETPLRYILAAPGDEDAVVAIYTEIGTWLHEQKGVTRQWFRQLPPEDARQFIDTGELYLAYLGEEHVGALRLTPEPDRLWTENPAALYLHSLAVRRAYAGHNLGRAMLSWVEDQARAAGKERQRLDCMADNLVLRRYYIEAGYTPLGIHPQYRGFALFEKYL